VLDRQDEGLAIRIRARLPAAVLGRLKQQTGVEIQSGA
jgi:hypothetical protein